MMTVITYSKGHIIKQLVMRSNHGSQNIRKSNNRLKTC
jgi:hypothetical protein